MRASLIVAIACVALAFGLLGWAAVLLRARAAWALLVPFATWVAVLLPWLARHASWTAGEHQRGMYRALTAWAITDVLVLLVFAS
jgi:hypothetical protein